MINISRQLYIVIIAAALAVPAAAPRARAEEPMVLKNRHYTVTLDRKGRGLLGIVHHGSGQTLLKADTPRPYLAAMVGRRGVVPVEYGQAEMVLVSSGKDDDGVTFRYRLGEDNVTIDLRWTIDDSPWLGLACRVENRSDLRVLSVTLPMLNGLAIDKPDDDVLVIPDHAGRFIENPARYGQYLRRYCGSASMCWMDLYDRGGGALYLGGVNRPVLVTDLQTATSVHGGARLLLRRHLSLAPGKTASFKYTLGLHDGDWHTGADRYRSEFHTTWADHPYGTLPDWMKRSHGYAGSRDPDEIKWIGVLHSQNWGWAGAGACPTYYLPHDANQSGPRLDWSVNRYLQYQDVFAEINKTLRDGGCSVGYYIHGESISPYYCFADQLYGQPKKRWPHDLLPPDGQWYIRNRLYWYPDDTPDNVPDWQALWDPPKKRGKSFPVMSCTSPEWHDYLAEWTVRYVRQYNCNVMYYDTIGARPPFIDYNPHHGYYHNPRWTEGIMTMFQTIRTRCRATGKVDPMGVLIEGCGDVYGLVSGHMTSNFDEGQSVYRYTLPEQILYSGLSNGGWTEPKPRLRRAFIHGSRFDLLKAGYFFKRVVSLRRATERFTYHRWAEFRDDIGLGVSVGGADETALEGTTGGGPGIEEGEGKKEDPDAKDKPGRKVRARWFRVDDDATRAVMLTFDNPDGIDDAVARLKMDGKPFHARRAFAFTLDGDVLPWEVHTRDGALEVKVPTSLLSTVVVVDHAAGEHAVNVWLDEDYDRAEPSARVTLTNFTGRRTDISLTLGAEGHDASLTPTTLSLEPGEIRRVSFKTLPAPPPVTLTLKAVVPGARTDHWLGVMPLVAGGGFEDRAAVPEAVKGNACAVVTGPGPGKTGRKWTHKQLYLKPGKRYRLSAMVRREGDFRWSAFTIFDTGPKHNTYKPIKSFAGTAKAHDWKRLDTVFKTPDTLNNPVIYFYLHDGDSRLLIDDLTVEPVEGD